MNGDPCPAATGATPPPLRPRGEKTASEKLAEKLLLGWTMLGDTCPQCATVPLMRDKQRQLFCVACETFLIKEEDVKEHNMNKATAGDQQQRQASGNEMVINEAEVTGRVQYRLGGLVPLSAAMEESERLVATATTCSSAALASHDCRGGAAAPAAGRDRGRPGCTGGDSRKTESSSDESECDSSFADSKVSPALLSWRENVRRRCWASSPSCVPSHSSFSSSLPKASQGDPRGEEAAATRGRGGGGSPRSLRSAGRVRRNTRQGRRNEEEEDAAAVTDIFTGLRESTLRKIQRYRAWLDVSGDDCDGAVVEKDRQVFSALHAALQVLGDLHRGGQ